jgi:RND family efflux transporter MFP subunit
MTKKKTILISISLLAASVLITFLLFLTAPEAEMEGASKKTAMLVDVIHPERGDYHPKVVATGTVQPSIDISLSTQVGGEVIAVSDKFIPGSFVREGETLLQINPADYENTLMLRKSDLALSESDLEVEMGRQDVAQKDFELIGGDFSSQNQNLVLRKPQLDAAKANKAAAEAAVNQASLDLQRTTIKAPFDAHVISRNANVGSQLAPGTDLGRLVGMREYWVVANVPIGKVNWLRFGEEKPEEGAFVKITHQTAWPVGQYREGRLFRLVGALDNQTRLARVLVTVPDPLLRETQNDTLPPLMIGTFVEVQIEARELKDVVRLNRDYLRQGNTVWVLNNGSLDIRKVEVLFEDPDYAYISKGLEENEQVVITDLATVVEGSPLRVEAE